MFIQSAPPGQPHRLTMMHDHGALAGQLARAFGNERFEEPIPLELVVHAITNHDAGWAAFDRDPATDPQTGLPFNVFGTPSAYSLPTNTGSPDFNQKHHPYCGLLSSMHTWGIYHGRYGIPGTGRLSRIPPDDKPSADAMLRGEHARQTALKAELGRSEATASWIEDGRLAQNYKLLQFCDVLAIYFNIKHPEQRVEQTIPFVPLSRDRDITVTIRPQSPDAYALSPFPFAAEGAEFAFPSRLLSPGQHVCEGGWARLLANAPTQWETFRLIAG